MMVLAAGASLSTVLLLWIVLILRILPSILYVRARLRLAKGKPVSPAAPLLTHIGTLVLALWFAISSYANSFVVLATAMLLVRAFYGLLLAPRDTAAKVIGFQEMGVGLGYVVLAALAFA
jgi:hypothetical protein